MTVELRSMKSEQAKRLARSLIFTEGVEYVYGSFANPGKTYRDVLEALCTTGVVYAFTAYDDGPILGLQGYTCPWKGVAECWVAITEAGSIVPASIRKDMLRIGIRLHKSMMDCWELHRIQTTSPVESPYHERMVRVAKLAGFEYEGTMKAYTCTGVDCMVWSMTNKENEDG